MTADDYRAIGAVRPPLLEVDGLSVLFDGKDSRVLAVDDVSLSVGHGESLAIVGESGSGKSALVKAILGILPKALGRVETGTIRFEGRIIADRAQSLSAKLRGRDLAYIPQDPLGALNPLFRIGDQMCEAMRPAPRRRAERRARAAQLLASVNVPDATSRLDDFPHQFSGGMAQRVLIAMALANTPRLLIADEPTTALDVTVQAQVMHVLTKKRLETGASLLFITHDLGLVASSADRVVVMREGRIVEEQDVRGLFEDPHHEYTRHLLNSIPRMPSRYGSEGRAKGDTR